MLVNTCLTYERIGRSWTGREKQPGVAFMILTYVTHAVERTAG